MTGNHVTLPQVTGNDLEGRLFSGCHLEVAVEGLNLRILNISLATRL